MFTEQKACKDKWQPNRTFKAVSCHYKFRQRFDLFFASFASFTRLDPFAD